jgi:hypothetical protein
MSHVYGVRQGADAAIEHVLPSFRSCHSLYRYHYSSLTRDLSASGATCRDQTINGFDILYLLDSTSNYLSDRGAPTHPGCIYSGKQRRGGRGGHIFRPCIVQCFLSASATNNAMFEHLAKTIIRSDHQMNHLASSRFGYRRSGDRKN